MREPTMTIALPSQWEVHDPSGYSVLAEVPSLNPVLRSAIRATSAEAARPDLVASLLVDVQDHEGSTLVVIMASLVVYCLAEPDTHSAVLEPVVRREVPIVDDIKADFYELPIFVHDEVSGLSAFATFTTPNLPLVADMEPGFRSIAASIRFVPAEQGAA